MGISPPMRIAFLPLALFLMAAAHDPQARTLAEASRAFDDAQFHHDRARLERFLAPDFVFVARSGEALKRGDFIAGATMPGEKLKPFVIRDHKIEPLGRDGGVVSGEGLIRGTRNGKRFASHFRYADVFARRNGRWVVVYIQVTALPDAAD
jgi:ketosteroid isomerase-like protein